MNTYTCVEVNSLRKIKVKAKNFEAAKTALLIKEPRATMIRAAGASFIHWNMAS